MKNCLNVLPSLSGQITSFPEPYGASAHYSSSRNTASPLTGLQGINNAQKIAVTATSDFGNATQGFSITITSVATDTPAMPPSALVALALLLFFIAYGSMLKTKLPAT